MVLPEILLAFNLCFSRCKEIFPPKYSYDTVKKLKLIDRNGNWNQKPKSKNKFDNNRAKGFHQVQIIIKKKRELCYLLKILRNIPSPRLINSIPQSPFIAPVQQEVAKSSHRPFPTRLWNGHWQWGIVIGNNKSDSILDLFLLL